MAAALRSLLGDRAQTREFLGRPCGVFRFGGARLCLMPFVCNTVVLYYRMGGATKHCSLHNCYVARVWGGLVRDTRSALHHRATSPSTSINISWPPWIIETVIFSIYQACVTLAQCRLSCPPPRRSSISKHIQASLVLNRMKSCNTSWHFVFCCVSRLRCGCHSNICMYNTNIHEYHVSNEKSWR